MSNTVTDIGMHIYRYQSAYLNILYYIYVETLFDFCVLPSLLPTHVVLCKVLRTFKNLHCKNNCFIITGSKENEEDSHTLCSRGTW